MKVSINLPEDDVAFLDEYSKKNGIASRSASIHLAVSKLRTAQLVDYYKSAFMESEGECIETVWESTTADGLELDE
jgi:hypothetical protein